jgi:MFS transporter, DHA3 family, macrolide efflux protein
MTAPPETRQPELIGAPPPPVRRDPMVLTWLVGVAVSAFGDYVWIVALAWTAVHTLEPALAGVVIGIEMLPQAVLILVGGVIADRFDPRRILIAGEVARAVVLALGALAWQSGYDGALTLLAMALSFGVVAGLTIPSGMALVRQVVNPDDFGTVMGWNQVSGRVMRLLGAPAGGILVAWGGPVAAMVVDAATFAVIAVVLALVVRPRYRLPRAEHARWRDSFTDGIGYLRRSPTARMFVIGLTALNVFVSPVVALGLALRVEGSAWGPHWLGICDAALAAGAILGSLAAIRWQPTYAAFNGFRVLIVQGVALAVVGVPFIPVVLAGMFVVGVTAGLASVWLSGAFLKAIDPAYTGRVSSVTSLGDMTLMPLSMPLLGALAGVTSVLTSTMLFGLSMSVLCLWFATRRVIATLT